MYVDEKREGELLTPSLPGFIWHGLSSGMQSKSYDWVTCPDDAPVRNMQNISAAMIGI